MKRKVGKQAHFARVWVNFVSPLIAGQSGRKDEIVSSDGRVELSLWIVRIELSFLQEVILN